MRKIKKQEWRKKGKGSTEGREEDKEGRGRGRGCVDVFSHRPG